MAAGDPAASQQNELLKHMKPEDVPEALKEYMATTMPKDQSYDQLTVEQKFELYAARKKQQHPLYKTATGDYGVVPKGVEHKVELPKHAKHGKFSKEFASSGNFRFSGLSTSAPKSRYNPKSDGFL